MGLNRMAKKGSAMAASAIVAAVAGSAFIGCSAGAVQAGILAPSHVVVVIEENHSYSQIVGNTTDAPYINNTLIGNGGLLYTQSYSPEHPSQPNYLDLFAGSDQGITGDYFPTSPQYSEPLSTPNLAAQLINAGYSFKEYNQTYSAIDNTTNYNQATYNNGTTNQTYARKHNAVINWVNPSLSSVSGNQLPLSTMTGFSEFPTTAAGYAALPTVSFVIPNLAYDMHNGTIQAGDSFLQQNLNGYVQWAKTNNSLLLVTWDENNYTLQDNNHIATIINGDTSLYVPGQSSQMFNSYSVLRALESMYGLGYAGNAATSPSLATNSAGQLAAVPEPAPLALIALGALAFLIPARRRRGNAGR